MRLFALILVVLATSTLSAAEGKPKPKPAGDGPRTGEAGQADAEAAFARQKGNAPTPIGGEPAIVGAYVWGGRADEQYKPFFQWDLRLTAGNVVLSGLKARTITLMPNRSLANTGAWVEIGEVAAGASKDLHLRQNCPAFSSYQLELSWSGGSARYVAADKTTLPVSATSMATMAYLLTTGYMHDPEAATDRKAKSKPFEVSWYLWNVGGAQATEVVQTVKFLDLAGKELHREVVTLKDPVPAGAALEQKITLKTLPKGYQLLSVSAECAVPLVAQGPADGGFTGTKDVEIVGIAVAAGSLSAKVRNGLAKDLSGVVVVVTLLDASGVAVEKVRLAAGDLVSGAETAVSAPVKATAFAGYEVGWEMEKSAAPTPPRSAAPAGLTVDGLRFVQAPAVVADGTLYVKGSVTNDRKAALTGLVITFTARGGGAEATATFSIEALGVGEEAAAALAFPGLETVEALEMTWKAGGK